MDGRMSTVSDLTERRLSKASMTYSVTITHYPDRMFFSVQDVQDDERSRRAVAADLMRAADRLLEVCNEAASQ